MLALVTRPIEDAQTLVAPLAARGLTSLVEPLLTIRFLPGTSPDLSGVQALVFTSANGVRAFAAAAPRRDLAAFAVGERTAATARALGFGDVASAGGDVADLAALLVARLDPGKGALLHAAGSTVAGDLAGALAAAGFALRRAVLYAAEPARRLSPGAVAALQRGALDLALFFSPRTAASFVTLVRDAALGPACCGVSAICLSPAVAAALAPLVWRRVVSAASPSQAALLAALDRVLAMRPGGGEPEGSDPP